MLNIPANLQLPLMIVDDCQHWLARWRSKVTFMQLKISESLVTGPCSSSIPCLWKHFLHIEPFLDS